MTTPRTPLRSRPRAAALAAVFSLVALAACGGDDGSGDAGDERADALPDLELTSLDGGDPLHFADVGDTPLVLNMWATWCTPCRTEMPAFDRVAEAANGDDVRIVGVNIGDEAGAAQEFVDEVGVGFAQYLDEGGSLYADLGVTAMPSTVFVDGGEVVDVHAGALTEEELAAALDEQLGVTVTVPGNGG